MKNYARKGRSIFTGVVSIFCVMCSSLSFSQDMTVEEVIAAYKTNQSLIKSLQFDYTATTVIKRIPKSSSGMPGMGGMQTSFAEIKQEDADKYTKTKTVHWVSQGTMYRDEATVNGYAYVNDASPYSVICAYDGEANRMWRAEKDVIVGMKQQCFLDRDTVSPRDLLCDETLNRLFDVKTAELVGMETAGGAKCCVLKASSSPMEMVKVWLDPARGFSVVAREDGSTRFPMTRRYEVKETVRIGEDVWIPTKTTRSNSWLPDGPNSMDPQTSSELVIDPFSIVIDSPIPDGFFKEKTSPAAIDNSKAGPAQKVSAIFDRVSGQTTELSKPAAKSQPKSTAPKEQKGGGMPFTYVVIGVVIIGAIGIGVVLKKK